jgi:hypothetical protein
MHKKFWFILLLGACGKQHFGEGIGRPVVPAAAEAIRVGLDVTEVWAAGEAQQSFVEIANLGDTAIDLSGYRACSDRLCVAIAAESLAVGERAVVGAADLVLLAQAGEVIVFDAAGYIQAFLAWGIDPTLVPASRVSDAIWNGAAGGDRFIPLPFPLAPDRSINNEDGQQGCAAPTPGTPIETWEDCGPAARSLSIQEIFPAQTAGGDSWVEIQNVSARALSVYGVRLCTSTCGLFARDAIMDAGARVVVHVGAQASSAVVSASVFALPQAAAMDQNAAEVALLAPGGAVLAENSLIDYVSYGSGAKIFLVSAIAQGLISGNEDIPIPNIPGDSLSLGATGWSLALPTPGDANP